MDLMRNIPEGKTIVIAFSGGESSAYQLKLILEKYGKTHKIIVIMCNTGEEDEETFVFTQNISTYFDVEIVFLEYRRKVKKHILNKSWVPVEKTVSDFEVVSFENLYRYTDFEIENRFPNHPFRFWIEDYGLPAYPNRTCTREMKERTISRYLSSIGIKPKNCVRCVGIRLDEISNRTPDPKQYYELIISRVTKKIINRFFEFEMPFRLNIPSWLGNCGACISKSIRSLCTIARYRPEKFLFFKVISEDFGVPLHEFFRDYNTIDSIFELSKDESIKDAKDNRYDTEYTLEFDFDLDSEGACGGNCEPFS